MRHANRFWWRWLAATAALFAVTWGLLAAMDTGPRPARVLLLVALATASMALVNVSLVSDGPDWAVDSTQSVALQGQDTRLGMYTRVIAGHLDARVADPTLRDRFADLADRRLRQRHGIAIEHPEATVLFGVRAAEILTGPPRRLSRDEIAHCVQKIEEL